MTDNKEKKKFYCYVKPQDDLCGFDVLATRNGYQYSGITVNTREQLEAVRDEITNFLASDKLTEENKETTLGSHTE